MFQIPHLAHADAQRIVDAIRVELEKGNRGAAIAVTDDHGELMVFLRTDGCPLSSITIAMNKCFTAARERKESAAVGLKSRNEGFPMSNFGDLRFTAWGGGVPILRDGHVVGAVAVSGLSEAEDITLAKLGISALG